VDKPEQEINGKNLCEANFKIQSNPIERIWPHEARVRIKHLSREIRRRGETQEYTSAGEVEWDE
jgi:hypothetical protein